MQVNESSRVSSLVSVLVTEAILVRSQPSPAAADALQAALYAGAAL